MLLHPLSIAYLGLLAVLCAFAVHRLWLLLALPRTAPASPAPAPDDPPRVLVQLPLYNEPAVGARLVDAAAALDYPADRLAIQVLDDSDDRETADAVAARVDAALALGICITHVRRGDRAGYKAGALAHGLAHDDAPLVALFDADFIPQPTFLRDLVGHFDDPRVGMVQARWGHLNRDASFLTRAQATSLDGHFALEHFTRAGAGRFFNFNGTAGIWRRAAIDDAGGWRHDTLTEDLDLSLRAYLRGWRFVYRGDVVAPAELPGSLAAFRGQQHRWAKGAAESARLLLGPLWRSRLPLTAKVDASVGLLANIAYLVLAALALVAPAVFLWREWSGPTALAWFDVAAVIPATGVFAAWLWIASRRTGRAPMGAAVDAASAMLLGIGMSLNNAHAVLEGLLGRRTPFVRTPKTGAIGSERREGAAGRTSRGFRFILPILEASIAKAFLFTAATAAVFHAWWAVPFTLLFAAGFATPAFLAGREAAHELAQRVAQRRHATRPQPEVP